MNEVSRTHTVDTSTTEPLPPIQCAPWCESGDGHPNASVPEDQYCIAGYSEQELQRKPEQIRPGGSYFRRTISLSLEKDPFSEPYISMGVKELTIDEAEAHARNVLALVEAARGVTA